MYSALFSATSVGLDPFQFANLPFRRAPDNASDVRHLPNSSGSNVE